MSEKTELVDDMPITQEEMIDMFGTAIPEEAVKLVFEAPAGTTCGALRKQLRDIAASRRPTTAGDTSATHQLPVASEGFVLVPREPTEEMIEAGRRQADAQWGDFNDEAISIYRDMIDAAPTTAPAADASVEERARELLRELEGLDAFPLSPREREDRKLRAITAALRTGDPA